MATGTRALEEPETAAANPGGSFGLAIQWNVVHDSARLHCSEYQPRPALSAFYPPERSIMVIWAKGISLSIAEQWAHQEGLRGVVQLPDGKICIWSGGLPTLEYASDDWCELAQRTLEEACFGPNTNHESICRELPPLEELINRADITFSDSVHLACFH